MAAVPTFPTAAALPGLGCAELCGELCGITACFDVRLRSGRRDKRDPGELFWVLSTVFCALAEDGYALVCDCCGGLRGL